MTLKAILNYIIGNPKNTELPDKLLISHFYQNVIEDPPNTLTWELSDHQNYNNHNS